MTSIVFHLRAAGLILLILAFGHIYIARRFEWRAQAQLLTPFNGQAMLVHAFFIALTVGFMGALALFWPLALVTPSPLGLPITAGLTLFWTIRLYCQWFIYDRGLWRGKRFETVVHLAFSACWLYLAVVFAVCWRCQ